MSCCYAHGYWVFWWFWTEVNSRKTPKSGVLWLNYWLKHRSMAVFIDISVFLMKFPCFPVFYDISVFNPSLWPVTPSTSGFINNPWKSPKWRIFPFYPTKESYLKYQSAANSWQFRVLSKTAWNQDAGQSEVTEISELMTVLDTTVGNTFWRLLR